MQTNVFYFDSAIGRLGVAEDDGRLTAVILPGETFSSKAVVSETSLLRDAAFQINMFLEGRRRDFDLPLAPKGTDFQVSVWRELTKIPYGETRTYKSIAASLGNERLTRAVGSACGRNPLPLIIPCHRVIGSDGSLTGYRGGKELKEKLLGFEALI